MGNQNHGAIYCSLVTFNANDKMRTQRKGQNKVISMSCSDAHGGGNVWASFRINKKAVTFITEVYL